MAEVIVTGGGIYAIWNRESGKCYVGSAVSFVSRWSGHRVSLRENKHHSKKLQNAWNKRGAECFEFVVLEYVQVKSDLLVREQWWIDELSAAKEGYNICSIAGSPLGTKQSRETRLKRSAALTGRTISEETKQKLKAAAVGRKPPCSQEVVAKRAEKLRGKKRPQHAIDASAAARRGAVASDETRAKLSAAKSGKKLGPMTDEHRANLSKARLGVPLSTEHRKALSDAAKKRGAPVLTLEAISRGASKRKGATRTPEQRQRMREGRVKARALREQQATQ